MNILISGAQCVGKTTLINSLKSLHSDWVFYDEVVRKLALTGIQVNELGNDETQYVIMEQHAKNISEANMFGINVFDRGPLDCFAHSAWLYQKGKINSTTYRRSMNDFSYLMDNFDEVFFIAPEFEMVDDGFRSTSKQFQTEINQIFLDILREWEIDFTILKGSVLARIETLHNILNIEVPK